MHRLRIQLFGDFQILSNGTLLTRLNSPRTQALLALLVLNSTAAQPRYHVAFQLWPDAQESVARANLRYQLYLVRRAIPNLEEFLYSDDLVLQWREGKQASSDTQEFTRALEQATIAERSRDAAGVRSALARAVELYRGDLLPSCYDDWILAARERFRQLFINALEQLTELVAAEHEFRSAIGFAQELLRHDPLHEATYRRLMKYHAAIGDRVGAVRVYQTCVALLRRELDVEPSSPTRQAYEHLLRKRAPAPSPKRGSRSPTKVMLQAASLAPNNLPLALTSFVGRERELAEIKKQLATTKLFTLTGAGGSGKTRLALEVAAAVLLARGFPDGVWRVGLEGITDGTLVLQAVASVLGVREQGGKPLETVLIQHLRPKQLLLILDNCEHVTLASQRLVNTLLSACPNLHILATSREPLGIAGELTLPLPALSVPPARRSVRSETLSASALMQFDAVRLFVERAVQSLPTFTLNSKNAPAVLDICRRLDGIPLAIELAAARVHVLSPEQIAVRLDKALELLTRPSRATLARHRTLRATLDWSYGLLSEQEQMLLRRLSVFSGGFTLEAAEAIVSDNSPSADPPGDEISLRRAEVLDLLSNLVDKSLIVTRLEELQNENAGYRLLETVRQYAREKLAESGELDTLRRKHARFFLKMAEAAEPKMLGPEQAYWSSQLEQEHVNLRAALEWASEGDDYEFGLRLAGALWRFWIGRAHYNEGRGWLSRFLEREGKTVHKLYRAKALLGASALALPQADYDTARAFAEESLRLYSELGNRRGTGLCLFALAILEAERGDELGADALLEASLKLWRELGDARGIATALYNLGERARYRKHYRRAAQLYEECLEIYRQTQDRGGVALAQQNLGLVAQHEGDWTRAARLLRDSIKLWQELGGKGPISLCLDGFASVAVAQDNFELAACLLGAAEAIRDEIGMSLEKVDRVERDRIVMRVRAALDDAAFEVAWAKGEGMRLEQAVEYARLQHG